MIKIDNEKSNDHTFCDSFLRTHNLNSQPSNILFDIRACVTETELSGYSHIFGELLLISDGALNGFEKVLLRLQYVGDGGEPLLARFLRHRLTGVRHIQSSWVS